MFVETSGMSEQTSQAVRLPVAGRGQLIIAFENSSTMTCPPDSLYSGAAFRPWDGMTALEHSKRCNSCSMRRFKVLGKGACRPGAGAAVVNKGSPQNSDL